MALLCLEDLRSSVDELKRQVKELQDLLSKEEYEAITVYLIHETAKQVCMCSRYVHKNVWVSQPENNDVDPSVILALEEAKASIDSINKRRIDDAEVKESFTEFSRNISLRARNIRDNYLKGRPSNFNPAEEHPS